MILDCRLRKRVTPWRNPKSEIRNPKSEIEDD
jgi:hypothetical protein